MKLSIRKIFIFTILVICIIVFNLAVYFQLTEKSTSKNPENDVIIDTDSLIENFQNIFRNELQYQENIVNVDKVEYTEELIYTSFLNQDKIENAYELNVHIPYINIQNEVAQAINEEIQSLFYSKAEAILAGASQNTIYHVTYQAYINDNILSLIIQANLKEGDNPQRVIIKTYNYNLSSNSNLGIKEILEYRKITEEYAQNKINETIKQASENANRYQELGYSMYLRNAKDNMYKIMNTKIYFLGENKALYILYPYGNSNYTSEVDLLVI